MNLGVAIEAFERHLENLKHVPLPGVEMESSDIESEGYRWVLYKMSSGSTPYYLGPDTALSQMKAQNASIVSDINTIVMTIQGILTIVNSNFKEIKPSLDNLFIEKLKTSNTIESMPGKIWDGITDDVRQEILNAIGASGFSIEKNLIVIEKEKLQ